jgi:hypothetical protein
MNQPSTSTKPPAKAASTTRLSEQQAREAEALITRYQQVGQMMLEVSQRHHGAIGRADNRLIAQCVQQQQMLATQLAELEAQRSMLLKKLGLPLSATLSIVAERAMPSKREELLMRAAAARNTLGEALKLHEVIRQASQTLMLHMQGLVQQVSRQLSGQGSYGRVAIGGAGGMNAAAAGGRLDVTT